MRTLLIILLAIICHSCTSNELPTLIEEIYTLNRAKEFNKFRNWVIYTREGKDNVYLFDYMQNDQIDTRYLVVHNDTVVFKEIFPKKDTVFHVAKIDSLYYDNSNMLSIDLYFDFKDLEVDEISYLQNEDLFLLKRNGFTLIHSVKPLDNITNIKRFNNYKKIDEYWYYFEEE